MSRRLPRLAARLVVIATLLVPAGASAQGGIESLVLPSPVTREALTSKIAELERARGGDATLREERLTSLRTRLRDGDFRPGDRIALLVQGETVLSDTFVVQAGGVIQLPNLGAVSLAGVLRSEAQEHLKKELGRYLQRPDVRATPLLQVAVIGRVGRAGFHVVPATALFPDVITAAGGYTADADPTRTFIRRNARQLWSPEHVRHAIANGLSVDAMDLRPNDEIVVEERRRRDIGTWVQIVAAVAGVAGTIAVLTTR